MTPEQEQLAMDVYLPLMDEVVARIDVVNFSVRNEQDFAPGLVRELCYLQFRTICELVAVGCLAIYGRQKLPRRLMDTWEAPRIINELKKLDPNCYPQPASITRDGRFVDITGRAEVDHLTRERLVALWGKSGDILHRAPYSKVVRPTNPKDADLSDIALWGNRITALLNCHLIPVSPTKLMTVVLRDLETGLPSANFLTLSLSDNTATTSHHRLSKRK